MIPQTTTQDANQKVIKQQFLEALANSETLAEALEVCSMPRGMLCGFLFKDKTFLKAFDKVINLKLEIALLETALKSKAAGVLSFSLTNRLPKKYNKTKKEDKPPETAARIEYVGEE